jgi:hypothetical protein
MPIQGQIQPLLALGQEAFRPVDELADGIHTLSKLLGDVNLKTLVEGEVQ